MRRAVSLLLAVLAMLVPAASAIAAPMRDAARVELGAENRVKAILPSGVVEAEGHTLFLQRDPNGYQDSVNQYAYSANDPINHRDPTGQLADDPENPPDPAFVEYLKSLEASSGAPIYTGIIRSPNLRVRQLQDGIRGGQFRGSWQRTDLLGIAGEAVYARHLSQPIAGESQTMSRARRAVAIQPAEAIAQELSPTGVPQEVADAVAKAISEAGAPDVLGFMLGGKWSVNYLNVYSTKGTTQLGVVDPSYGPGGLQSRRVLSTGGSLLLAAEVKTVGTNSIDRSLLKGTTQVTNTARALAALKARSFRVGSSEGLGMLSVETRLDPWAALIVDANSFANASPSARQAAIASITKAGGIIVLYPGLLSEAGQLVSEVERGGR